MLRLGKGFYKAYISTASTNSVRLYTNAILKLNNSYLCDSIYTIIAYNDSAVLSTKHTETNDF